jgi:hypothetical protein
MAIVWKEIGAKKSLIEVEKLEFNFIAFNSPDSGKIQKQINVASKYENYKELTSEDFVPIALLAHNGNVQLIINNSNYTYHAEVGLLDVELTYSFNATNAEMLVEIPLYMYG